jgi:hypothetical protein
MAGKLGAVRLRNFAAVLSFAKRFLFFFEAGFVLFYVY